jgi:4-amino-4-deoxy-L-arabinose transferase-like glycosyltransferase
LKGRGAAVAGGAAVAFAVAVFLIGALRPLLLLDPDPAWALARLLLTLGVLAAAAGSGVLAGAVLLLWGRTPAVREGLPRLPLSAGALAGLAAAALLSGAVARFAALDRLPAALWVDDLSLIVPALSLEGNARDFADPVRGVPFGLPQPYGSVGVLYLELYRAALLLFGTTVFGVRFLSAAAGVVSIATAIALGRALLPRGGGTLAGLAVAGMRWHLILSRWGWNAIVLVPVLDIAALLLVRARRRRSAASAAVAGLTAGIAAHIYLAAWIGFLALGVFLLWPDSRLTRRWRLTAAGLFAAAFFLAAAPLLWPGPDRTPYFRRAGQHNVLVEMRRQRSAEPLFSAAAIAVAAPWFGGDPSPWNDLPHTSRLGWILGIPVAAALARALWRPREDLSAFLLAQAGAAFASTVVWGTEMQPNGYRVAYLTTVTGVAAAAGALALLSLFRDHARRRAAIAIVGLFVISGALAARDVFVKWGPGLEVSEGYQGRDNLVARAVLRWQRYGPVEVDPDLATVLANGTTLYVGLLVRYGLDASGFAPASPSPAAGPASRRHFRVAPSGAQPAPGERAVESVRDGNGKEAAVVLGRRW